MRKVALIVVLALVVGGNSAWSLSKTLDGVIEDQKKSDLHAVQDTSKLAGVMNEGLDKSYNAITEPMKPVLDPIRKVRDVSVRASKDILNGTWDALTYFSPHRQHTGK